MNHNDYAALYIRVSTDKQEELSPDAQKRLLLEYAERNHLLVVPEYIYTDIGISGRNAQKRPAFMEMIALAKSTAHPIDCILIWKYSRFARNQEEAIVYKNMLRKQCNVNVISISEPQIDGIYGTLIERILEWMDEYYSINLSDEVLRGMTEKAMRGGYQTSPPYGYRSAGNGCPFLVVPEEKEVVQYMFTSYVYEQKTCATIARSLNEHGIRTKRYHCFEARSIARILKNPFYTGTLIWNNIEREGSHETFISKELYEAANDRLQKNVSPKYRRAPSSLAHWSSGLLTCAVCGASMSMSCNKNGFRFFQCWKYAKGIHNGSNYLTLNMLEKNVYKYLDSLFCERMFIFSFCPASVRSIADTTCFSRDLQKLAIRESRIHEAYESGVDTLAEYKANKERLHAERIRLQEILNTSDEIKKESQQDQTEILHSNQTIRNLLENDVLDKEQKATFLRSIFSSIVWDKQKNTLTFVLIDI